MCGHFNPSVALKDLGAGQLAGFLSEFLQRCFVNTKLPDLSKL
jgi:hypothetical protein